MNEQLVKKIMDETVESSPDRVNIRLVIERDSKTPPESEATTLSKAIAAALDLGLDLVEIDIKHEMPVVRAVKYEAKLYRASKEKAKTPKDPGSVVKEFRFKAKIEDNDFSRKTNDVIDALEKGHKCKISARCPFRMVGPKNPSGAGAVIDRVLAEVQDAGEASKLPEVNKEKTQASVLLIPTK
jgi:translation initiation factor IF-3